MLVVDVDLDVLDASVARGNEEISRFAFDVRGDREEIARFLEVDVEKIGDR